MVSGLRNGVVPALRYTASVVVESLGAFFRDDGPFFASGIAFYSLFSIFSVLFLLTLLLGLFGADPRNLALLTDFMEGMVPDEASRFVQTVLDTVSRPVPANLIPFALLVTLWTASNVFQALIHSLNRVYHIDDVKRAFWRTRLFALGIAGGGAALLVGGFVLYVFGGELDLGLKEIQRFQGWLWSTLFAWKKPVSVLVVFLGASLLYWIVPRFNLESRVSWPGATVFTVLWILVTTGFNYYLREFAVFDRVYGPLATVVVMVVWIQLSAQMALFGGEVNAAIHRRRMERRQRIPAAAAEG